MPLDSKKTYTLQIAFDDHDGYFAITGSALEDVLAEPDLKKRDALVLNACTPTSVIDSYDVDLVLVIDEQPAEERWADLLAGIEEL